MFNADFFGLANKIVWSASALYVFCIGVMLLLTVNLGNKKEAQKSSIYAIAERHIEYGLYDIINFIIEENARILMPIKTNWLLISLTALGAISAVSTLFLTKLAQSNSDMIGYWTASYALFIVFYCFASLLLWFQFKYVATLKRLQDKHEDGGKKIINIIVK